jgi:hypothetical protein
MEAGIVAAFIGGTATIVAAVIAAVISKQGKKHESRAMIPSVSPPTFPNNASFEAIGLMSWTDEGKAHQAPVKGTVSESKISLDWQEIWDRKPCLVHAVGESQDGVHFRGNYGYPMLRDHYTFDLVRESLGRKVKFVGSWRNSEKNGCGEWVIELTLSQ